MVGIAFEIPGTQRARAPKKPLNRIGSLSSLCRPGRVEQLFDSSEVLVACTDRNAFVQAAHDAFYEHYPLSLSPDAVWHCLAQGFAQHVKLNAEALRHAFVLHKGKLTLRVVGLDFLPGRCNPWPEVFAEFSQQLAGHLGKLHGLLVADFSTTGPLERAASEVLLMDAFQGYFKYEMMMGCGIPSVTLLGTPDDWIGLRRRAAIFSEYGMGDWVKVLLPVLDKLVESAQGSPDIEFWKSFFRYRNDSGAAELTGWINLLFPYIWRAGIVANPFMADWQELLAADRLEEPRDHADIMLSPRGPSISNILPGLSRAPVKFTGIVPEVEGAFVAGMFGVVQDVQTLALRPEFGWAIVFDG